jgi:hypothetical protein
VGWNHPGEVQVQRGNLYQLCLHIGQGRLVHLLLRFGQGIKVVVIMVQEQGHLGGAIYLTKVLTTLVQGPIQESRPVQFGALIQQEVHLVELVDVYLVRTERVQDGAQVPKDIPHFLKSAGFNGVPVCAILLPLKVPFVQLLILERSFIPLIPCPIVFGYHLLGNRAHCPSVGIPLKFNSNVQCGCQFVHQPCAGDRPGEMQKAGPKPHDLQVPLQSHSVL